MKQTDTKSSYTSADTVPIKTLLDQDLVQNARKGIIPPIHAQVIPTNKCNLNCPFCSCSKRTKELEMNIAKAFDMVDLLKFCGCKAMTITGGGEPLKYDHLEAFMNYVHKNEIKMGLVTNGLLLDRVSPDTLNLLTWCRISNGDDRRFIGKYPEMLAEVTSAAGNVDWAFSHVVSNKPNYEEIARVVAFANRAAFTHVRLVADLFAPEAINMKDVQLYLKSKNINDQRVIYQERKAHTRGGECYIGYLKPLISPDFKIYACCGVQYALATPSYDLPEELCLGSVFDLKMIVAKSRIPFHGEMCVKCYYMNYNTILKSMLSNIEHREFL